MTTFYTGRGDEGYTDLLGARVPKFDPRTELIGTLDESTSQIGVARATATSERTKEILESLQRDLYQMMAELAFVSEDLADRYRMTGEQLQRLEELTDGFVDDVPLAREFILPGDSLPGAHLDVARVVVRRAERIAAKLTHDENLSNPIILAYLNRLSSLLFILGRYEDQEAGVKPKLAKGDR
ncbi:MAG: cob(I)yrinic acid a,c-diamide adenosyltransferase [Thermomicrobiales bacterium]